MMVVVVKIRLHTQNELPMLPGSALKVPGGVVGSYPLSSLAPTPVEVELGCDNFTWQLAIHAIHFNIFYKTGYKNVI